MRLNPFTMWWESRRDRQAMIEMAGKIGEDMKELLARVTEHQTNTAHELFKLKNPWYAAAQSTMDKPLTEEQEKIVKDFFENSKLPEQIRRGFATGGHTGMRSALGRFGEAPSEQTRSTDAVHPVPPGDVNVTVQVTGDYPGNCYKHPHLDTPPLGTATGFRDPQPPPRQKSMDELIREEHRVMDREAWDQLDLDDIKPKE